MAEPDIWEQAWNNLQAQQQQQGAQPVAAASPAPDVWQQAWDDLQRQQRAVVPTQQELETLQRPEGSPEYQDLMRARPLLASEIPSATARAPAIMESLMQGVPQPTPDYQAAIPRRPLDEMPATVQEAYREAGGGLAGIINAAGFASQVPTFTPQDVQDLIGMGAYPERAIADLLGQREAERAAERRFAEAGSSFTTPAAVAQLGLFKYPLARVAFGAQQLGEVPSNVSQAIAAYQAGNAPATAAALTDATLNAAMGLPMVGEPVVRLGLPQLRAPTTLAESPFGLADITVPGATAVSPISYAYPKPEPYTGAAPEGFSLAPLYERPYHFSDEARANFLPTGAEPTAAQRVLAQDLGVPVESLHPVTYQGGEGPRDIFGSSAARSIRDAEAIVRANGGNPIWIRSDTPAAFAGAHVHGSPDVFLNADALDLEPVREIASHEFGHYLQTAAPDLWGNVARHVGQTIDLARGENYLGRLEILGYKTDPRTAIREATSDVIKEALRDPLRFRRAVGDNLALRVLDELRNWLANIIERIRGRPEGPQSFEDLTSNLQATRQKVMQAITQLHERRAGAAEPAGAVPGEVSAARIGPARDRARETSERALRESGDIAKSDMQRVLDHGGSSESNATRFRENIPSGRKSRSDRQQILNAKAFFKGNLLKAARAALKEAWGRVAAKQYQGYNIYAHTLADEFGHKPETVMVAESANSPNTSPDNSFEATRRTMKILRDDTEHVFDKQMEDWARNATYLNAKRDLVHLYEPDEVDYLLGKKFSDLPKADAPGLDPKRKLAQAQWLRAFDEIHHPDRTLRVVRPDGTLGDKVKTTTGANQPFAWTPFPQIQNGIDAIQGTRKPDQILKTAKVANYYMSKLLAFERSNHVVVDTHHTSAAWGNSLPASHPLIADVFGAGRGGPDRAFAGYYSIVHEATLEAAKELGMDPKEFQALVWSYQRGLKSPDVLGPTVSGVIQGLWTEANRGRLTEKEAYDGTEQIARDFHGGVPAPIYYGRRPGSADAPRPGVSGKPAELPSPGRLPEPAIRGGGIAPAPGAPAEPGPAGGLTSLSRAGEPAGAERRVPVGAYGTRIVSPDVAKFIDEKGFGRSHLNEYLINAYEAKLRGNEDGVKKQLRFLRSDLNEMGIEDANETVNEIRNYFEYDWKKPARIAGPETEPSVAAEPTTGLVPSREEIGTRAGPPSYARVGEEEKPQTWAVVPNGWMDKGGELHPLESFETHNQAAARIFEFPRAGKTAPESPINKAFSEGNARIVNDRGLVHAEIAGGMSGLTRRQAANLIDSAIEDGQVREISVSDANDVGEPARVLWRQSDVSYARAGEPGPGYVGVLREDGAIDAEKAYRDEPATHEQLGMMGYGPSGSAGLWRYNPETRRVYWWDPHSMTRQNMDAVTNWLERKGSLVDAHEAIDDTYGQAFTEAHEFGGEGDISYAKAPSQRDLEAAAAKELIKIRSGKHENYVYGYDPIYASDSFVFQNADKLTNFDSEGFFHPDVDKAIRAQAEQAIINKRELGFARVEGPSQGDLEAAAASGDKQKMRGHIETIQRMTEVSPDVKQRVESWYTPTTLEAVHDQANAQIDRLGLEAAQNTFARARTANAATMALGHNLALRLDSLGRYDEAAAVRDDMAKKLTSPAQALWFISTIGKTSPEGLIRTAQKLVNDVIERNPKWTAKLQEFDRIIRQLQSLPEGPARDAATEAVLKQLAKVNLRSDVVNADVLNKLVEQHKIGTLSPDELRDALMKYFKIPRLTPENTAKILAAQKAWADATDPLIKMRRGAEMMDTVYGLIPSSMWDKIRATAVISMILHGRLPIRIGISNALRMFGQMTTDAILNVPRDIGNVFSGRSTITGEQLAAIGSGLAQPLRAFKAGYEDARLRGLTTVPSFKEGVKTMLELANLTTRGLYEASDITKATHTFSSRFGRLFEDAVTLVHNVVPYGFWSAGFRMSLARQMRIAGVETPTAEMISNAQLDGNKAIFYNDTALYKSLMAVRKALDLPSAEFTKGKYGLGTALIPFARVPAAVLTEGAMWTPFGLGKAGMELLRPFVVGGAEFRAKEFGDAMVKAALGTGSLMLAGYQLAKIGVMTGAPDENKDIEAMRKAAGWGGFRINLSELKRRALSGNWWTKSNLPADGDVIMNYNWLEPVAFGLAMGADIAHSQDTREIDLKRGKITSNAVVSALGAGVKSVLENPMLQNLQQSFAALTEGRLGDFAVDLFGNVPGNFVPSLVRQTGQYMDNTVRETRGGTIAEKEANRILSQIPGLSEKYPPRYDVFGEAMQRYNYGNNSLLNVFFNPAMVSKFRSNPELAEMLRIYQATGTSAHLQKNVPAKLFINGKQVQLTNDQVAAYQRYVGRESSVAITRVMASPAFAREPLQMKQAVMAQILGAVNNAAKIDLFGQSPVSIGMGARGPTVQKPTVMEIAAMIEARRQGLKAVPGIPAGPPNAPVWPLTPPPALPSFQP